MSKTKNTKTAAVLMVLAGLLILTVSIVTIAVGNRGKEPSETTSVSATSDRSDVTDTIIPTSMTDTVTQTDVTDTATTDTQKPVTDTNTKTETEPKTTSSDTSSGEDTTDWEKIPNDPENKRVAITFDDGPGAWGKEIADEVAKYGGHVTFFVVGNRISGSWGDEMAYAYEMGNEIAVHGYTHNYSYKVCSDAKYREELSKTEEAIRDRIGYTATLMRPIGGAITKERIASCPYAVIHWSVDSEDWKYKKESQSNVNTIVNNVMRNVENGDIILLHEIYKNSYEAFCIILEKLHDKGYSFVTVSELLQNPVPGKIYHCTSY